MAKDFEMGYLLDFYGEVLTDARFECTGPYAKLTTTEYVETLNKMLGLIRSIDEVNES